MCEKNVVFTKKQYFMVLMVRIMYNYLKFFNCYLTFDESGLNNDVLLGCDICNMEVLPKNPEFVNS